MAMKDWRKRFEFGGHITFENVLKPDRSSIEVMSDGGGTNPYTYYDEKKRGWVHGWSIWGIVKDGNSNRARHFKNKKDALKFAKEYMKKH